MNLKVWLNELKPMTPLPILVMFRSNTEASFSRRISYCEADFGPFSSLITCIYCDVTTTIGQLDHEKSKSYWSNKDLMY